MTAHTSSTRVTQAIRLALILGMTLLVVAAQMHGDNAALDEIGDGLD